MSAHVPSGPLITSRRGSSWIGTEPVTGPFGTVAQGPMYVEWESPTEAVAGPPWVLIHGGGADRSRHARLSGGRAERPRSGARGHGRTRRGAEGARCCRAHDLADADADVSLPQRMPEALAPIAAVVRGQQLAHALALALGYDPDAPAGLTKVTAT